MQHFGSIFNLLDSNQTYAERLSYDASMSVRSEAKAEGRRRNPLTWTYQGFTTTTLTDRGFTGHEHLD
jgi:hypothetical protein